MLFAILDLRLPDINGYEVAKILKQKHPKLPLIVYTASALKHDRDKFEDGKLFECVLLKPIDIRNFEEVMNMFLK